MQSSVKQFPLILDTSVYMVTLSEIKQPIQSHLDSFEKKFRQSMKSNVPLLDIITRYIIKTKRQANAADVCIPECRYQW